MAAAAGGIGFASNRRPAPPGPAAPAAVNAEALLASHEPTPAELREKELLDRIDNKATKIDVATDDVLELALLRVRQRHFADAEKAFDARWLALRGAFLGIEKEPRYGAVHLKIMEDLGRGVVASHADKAVESNGHIAEAVKKGQAAVVGAGGLKKKDAVSRLALEMFLVFNSNTGAWKKAVADAVERNRKALGDKLPAGLERLRGYAPRVAPPKS